MVSAHAQESQQRPADIDARVPFVVKPVVLAQLFEQLRQQLGVEWIRAGDEDARPHLSAADAGGRLSAACIEELMALGRIGYVRGIEAKLAEIAAREPASTVLVKALEADLRSFRFERFMQRLRAASGHD
jgi:hypothetical protein